MFKELKGLGVVVKQLSHALHKVVSSDGLSLFLLSLSFPLLPVDTFPVRSHLSR